MKKAGKEAPLGKANEDEHHAKKRGNMVRIKKSRKELFSYLNLPRMGGKEQLADTVAMAIDFMKYQGEVAYEASKKQAIALTSTASTIGIGWSAFFFGIAQESWFTSSIGLMMALAGTFILGYWTPKIMDKLRGGLDELGAAKFYNKWLSDSAESGTVEESQ